MNTPVFTTNTERIARLQFNYDEGAEREKLPSEIRERLDCECLRVSDQKLRFLYQNARESYSGKEKADRLREFNNANASKTLKSSWTFLGRA